MRKRLDLDMMLRKYESNSTHESHYDPGYLSPTLKIKRRENKLKTEADYFNEREDHYYNVVGNRAAPSRPETERHMARDTLANINFKMSKSQCQNLLMSVREELNKEEKAIDGSVNTCVNQIFERFEREHQQLRRELLNLLQQSLQANRQIVSELVDKYRKQLPKEYVSINKKMVYIDNDVERLISGLNGAEYKKIIAEVVTKDFSELLRQLREEAIAANMRFKESLGFVRLDKTKIGRIQQNLQNLYSLQEKQSGLRISDDREDPVQMSRKSSKKKIFESHNKMAMTERDNASERQAPKRMRKTFLISTTIIDAASIYSFLFSMFQNQEEKFSDQKESISRLETLLPQPSNKSSVCLVLPLDMDENIPHQQDGKAREKAESSLDKFANFVKYHCIEEADIWEGKASLPVLTFVDIFQNKLGYHLSVPEINCLRGKTEDGNLKRQHFSYLGLWSKKNVIRSSKSYGKLNSHKQFSQIERPSKAGTTKITKQIALLSKVNRSGTISPNIEKVEKQKVQNLRLKSTCDELTNTFFKTGFANDTIKDKKIEALRADLQMNSLQKKWEYVVMAGEMNKWLEESNQSKGCKSEVPVLKFKIINQNETFTIVKVDEQGNQEIVPEIVFMKKYKAMKKKKFDNPCKDVSMKTLNLAILGLAETNSGKAQANRMSQRDCELNEALLHIMRVKNILQHQHKILSEAAINT